MKQAAPLGLRFLRMSLNRDAVVWLSESGVWHQAARGPPQESMISLANGSELGQKADYQRAYSIQKNSAQPGKWMLHWFLF